MNLSELGIRFVPVAAWPGVRTPPAERRRSQFERREIFTRTTYDLDRELRALEAENIVLQTFHQEGQIRVSDGLPRATARDPEDPGVILTFDSRHGPLSFPCDTYETWQENLRGIALGMQALRAVDRYGVTRHGEQYRGWKALPGPGGSTTTMTAAAAAVVLSRLAPGYSPAMILGAPAHARAAYRLAARAAHPDVAGGSNGAFHQVQAAREVLDHHHGT